MSQDWIEVGWIALSAVVLGLSLMALREAWRDRRAVEASKLNGARRLIVGNSVTVQAIRVSYALVSLMASLYSFHQPNPAKYHQLVPLEIAMIAVVALGLTEILLATLGDLRVWRYLNRPTEVSDGEH